MHPRLSIYVTLASETMDRLNQDYTTAIIQEHAQRIFLVVSQDFLKTAAENFLCKLSL